MEVVSECELRAGSLVWLSRSSAPVLTVVCKATYHLLPGEAKLAEVQEDPNEEDNHWNDDPDRSLYAASDLAPHKRRCDVLVVGHAFAPGGEAVPSFGVHLAVAGIDKSILVFGERFLFPDGRVQYGAPASQVPLRYERASGGPRSANPVGMRADARDERGAVPLPPLQRFGRTEQEGFAEPIGFGPIAPTWPERRVRAPGAAGWSMAMWRSVQMPEGVDPSFFNVAPVDQQVGVLRADEPIVLENLHREHERLVTQLPGIAPRARIDRKGRSGDLTLVADTLWIDTDRAVATLVWRGQMPLDSVQASGRVVIEMDVQRSPSPRGFAELVDAGPTSVFGKAGPVQRALRAPPALPPESDVATTMHPMLNSSPTLPFAPSSAYAPPPDSQPHSVNRKRDPEETYLAPASPSSPVLPFTGAPDRAVAPIAAPALVSTVQGPVESKRWEGGLAAALAPPQTLGDAMVKVRAEAPAVASLIASPLPVAASLPMTAEPIHVAVLAPAAQRAPTDKPNVGSLAMLKKAPPPVPIEVLNATAASDAAARQPSRVAGDPLQRTSESAAALPAVAVEMLWFDPAFTEAIRKHGDWRDLITTLKPKPRDADYGEGPPNPKRQEAKDRREIAGVLARARPETIDGLHVAFARAIDEDGRFESPLVMTGGELEFPFDEIETLKATVAVVSPLAGPDDKRLKEMLGAAREALQASWAHMAERLTGQLREAIMKDQRSIPLRSIDSHIEKLLLEGRHLQKRTLLGQPWIRTTLALPDVARRIPTYLPAAPARELPALQRFAVRIIVEVRAQLDQYETESIALRVVALGRVISSGALR